MNENQENTSPKASGVVVSKPLLITVCVLFLILVLLIGTLVFLLLREDQDVNETLPSASDTTASTTEGVEDTTTVPVDETEPLVMLPNMSDLYAQNPDIAGYIRIEGTKLDYPVMYTPYDEQKYNHLNFQGKYKYAGTPFISESCSIAPESDNLVIYGHNMKNGTAFATVIHYRDESFYKKHPTIFYSTLYEEREYEVVAAFYDRVYFNYDEVFKYYEFIDYENEMQFNEAVEYYKSHSVYDTGVEPEYGDRFLTLVTCSYHQRYGRFVVVARIPGEEAPEEAE